MKQYLIFTLIILLNMNWARAQLNFSMDNMTAEPGETISLPVKVNVNQTASVLGLQFSIQWEEDILDFEQVHGFGLNNMNLTNFGVPNQTGYNNKLNVAWEMYPDAMNISQEFILFYIDFTIPSTIPLGTVTNVTFCENCTTESYDQQLNLMSTNLQDGQSEKNAQITIGQTLPISLLNFSAKANEKEEVLLEWSSSQEINNSHFEIERSKNGNYWETIGKENSKGNTNRQQNYSFLDIQALSGKSYYRLRQVDNNGAFSYSVIRQVNIQRSGLISYQNPIKDKINVSYYSDIEKEIFLTLYDTNGLLIKSLNVALGIGHNNINWETTTLAAGVYFLKILDKEKHSFKVVKY